MSNIDVKSMFESIKDSLKNQKGSGNSSYKDIMKLETGNTYTVRFIPNVKDPKQTFFHYFHHGFTSNETGQYVDSTCPTTWQERCPICEERFKLYKKGDEKSKALASLIRRMDKHYANVYVVNDPVNEENNGKIKVLRMGIRLYEKVQSAIDGDDADEFGSRVFDFSDAGCNFKIKVESSQDGNKKFANYSNSRFTTSSAIPGMTPEKIQELYASIFDLTSFVEKKSTDDLKEMLRMHAFGEKKDAAPKQADEPKAKPAPEAVVEETEKKPKAKTATPKSEAPRNENDAKIKELLDGIDA